MIVLIRCLVITLLFLTSLNCVNGQTHFIQAGFNKSNVSWHNIVQHNYNYDWNYFAGYAYEKPLSTNFNLNIALQFSQKGFVDRAPNNVEVRKETYEYIDFVSTISFVPHRSFGYFIGGNIALLLRDEEEIAHDYVDLGLVMGVEYNYKKWKLRAGYNHGLSSIFDESQNQLTADADITPFNSNFQLNFGYRIYGNLPAKMEEHVFDQGESYNNVDVGIRLYSLNAFTALVKTQKSKSQYIRYTLGINNINLERTEKYNYYGNLSFAAGIENRVPLDDNIELIHGLEPGFNIDFSSNSEDFDFGIQPYIGYVVGVYYHSKNERFRLGMETAPRFFVNFDFDEQGVVNEWSSGINLSSRVGLIATYTLKR